MNIEICSLLFDNCFLRFNCYLGFVHWNFINNVKEIKWKIYLVLGNGTSLVR